VHSDRPRNQEQAIIGCLLGMATADALGVWCENLSARRLQRFHSSLDRHHFLFGRGMYSDDTEHLCLTAQALITSAGAPEAFTRALTRRLRWWLLTFSAGIGWATLRSCLKLWLGFPATRSGVFSAGNGPAMRSPILGVCFGHDTERLRQLVRLSTRITHTDPRAEYGALLVALAAFLAATVDDTRELPQRFLAGMQELLGTEAAQLQTLLQQAADSARAGLSPLEFAQTMGRKRGVSGYMYHTVPVVIQSWLRYPDAYEQAIPAIIACGGDTDTTAALLGSIVGARVGKNGIPPAWLNGLWEWPCSVRWIERLGQRLAQVCATAQPQPPLSFSRLALLARNFVFLGIVLVHVFRRYLPPY
jgi:ADP-ribosylglycohydrolase